MEISRKDKTYDSVYYHKIVKVDEDRRVYNKFNNRLNRQVDYVTKNFPELKDLVLEIKNDDSKSTFDKLKTIKLLGVNYEFMQLEKDNPVIVKWIRRGVFVNNIDGMVKNG